ncbi:MAG: dihydroxy-acid dehydratase [Thermaerobacter sp.]|nr:dihydroxy-acid dehydratase [Thermaerobacter sp.]
MKLRSAEWFEGPVSRTFQHRMSMAAVGRAYADYAGRPIIGIANSWSDFNNCNLPHKELVDHVKLGVLAAGGYPMEFHTITTASDFVKPSDLLYRNLMAMDVEEMLRSQPIDGVVLLSECDKTTPAQLMGALSVDLPAIQLAAGHRASGNFRGERVTYATDFWRLLDEYEAGNLLSQEWAQLERCMSCSGGGCAVMGTASTMKSISEAIGMMLPGTSDIPAIDVQRQSAAEATGRRIVEMVREDLRPSQIVTEAALRNAMRVLAALGGSTNALIHLAAIAGRRGIFLRYEDFEQAWNDVPLLCDLQPSGAGNMDDFHAGGGLPRLLHELLPLLEGDAKTVSGRTLRQNYATVPAASDPVIGSLQRPIAPGPALRILRGNLAPDGAVLKESAGSPELMRHEGPAVVFEDYEDMLARIEGDDLPVTKDSVLVMRSCGPVGVPGMPEWGSIPIPPKLLRQGVRDMVRISDARMSGTGYGTVVLHVAPESAVGGPLALVHDGDLIALDVPAGRLELRVPESELTARRAALRARPATHKRGYLRLFAEHVMQAPEGCDLDFLRPGSAEEAGFVPPIVGRG